MDAKIMRTRWMAAGLAVAVAAGLSGCGAAAKDDPSSGGKGGIVLVHDQPAGDGTVIDAQIEGAKEVAEELGLDYQTVYVADPANYASTLQNIASTSPEVVVASFPRITDALVDAAEKNPEIEFVHIYAAPIDPPVDNLLTVRFKYYEAMYLSGVLAASMSETGKVAWVGGDTQSQMAADFNGFAAGAKSVDPNVVVKYGVVGDFQDANKAQTIASQLYEGGVDVIQTDVAGAGTGVLAAASQQPGRFVIGDNPGVYEAAPQAALGYVMGDFGAAVVDSVKKAVEEGFAGGESALGLGPVVYIEVTTKVPGTIDGSRLDAARSIVAEAAEMIEAGDISVPYNEVMP